MITTLSTLLDTYQSQFWVLGILTLLAATLSALALAFHRWQLSRRPPLVQLAEGYSGGLDLLEEAEERAIQRVLDSLVEVAETEMKVRAILERAKKGEEALQQIKHLRDHSPVKGDPQLQAIHKGMVEQAALDLLKIYGLGEEVLEQAKREAEREPPAGKAARFLKLLSRLLERKNRFELAQTKGEG